MPSQDYYQTLKVDRCATCNEIKQAYRALAHRFHPDVSKDLDGESKFKDISEAYRTLKQLDSRMVYDRRIRNFCVGTEEDGQVVFPGGAFCYSEFISWNYWFWFWLRQIDRER